MLLKTNASIFTEGSLGVAKNIFVGDNRGIYLGDNNTKMKKVLLS